jgi:hypothetical protein
VVSFTPRPPYPQGKSPTYQLDRRLDGPQNRSGRGDEKNFQPPPGLETPIIKNAYSYTSTPQYVFMAWCLVKHRDSFTFYLNRLFLSLLQVSVFAYSLKFNDDYVRGDLLIVVSRCPMEEKYLNRNMEFRTNLTCSPFLTP